MGAAELFAVANPETAGVVATLAFSGVAAI
jgi:hypothetical protein